MKKRLCRMGLGAILCATLLMGCGEKSATTEIVEQSTRATNSKLSGKLTYVSWNDNQQDQLQATIDGFCKKYPDVQIELQFTPWSEYWTKLEASAASGNMPDVITMHTNFAEKYANAGMITELDDLEKYDSSFSYNNLPEGVTRLYQFNEHTYGVAKDIDCVVLAYNKELFDKANLDYPNNTWTWKEFEEAAKVLTDKENGIYGIAAYNNMQEAWGSFLYQNGGSIINEEKHASGLNEEESIVAMEYYMNLLENYSPTTAQLAETDRRAMFASGNIGMIPIGNWQLNNFTSNDSIKDKFDIAPLPQSNSGKKATISNGLAYSVAADSPNKELAKQFVAYLGTEEANELASIGVSIPAYNGVVNSWAEKHSDLYNTQAIIESLEYGVQYVSTESRPTWEAALNVYLEKLFNGEMNVRDAFNSASEEINEILEAE